MKSDLNPNHSRIRKYACGSWACKSICCFSCYGGKQLARQRKGAWPDGVSALVYSTAAEIFAQPRAVRTARLFGIPLTTIHKYDLKRLVVCQAIRRQNKALTQLPRVSKNLCFRKDC
ncbi:hypothetical protein AVEN_125028-1 [Araneus ventricosus]|uniref:Uncharacterized protein n=1 Tax=Araneus ventricosus TaxID=182803 RepID=A0A4Y2GZ93_ARAVE|nr:hypothetical protein AVEN_125028-1 [Araneus ventricosus]